MRLLKWFLSLACVLMLTLSVAAEGRFSWHIDKGSESEVVLTITGQTDRGWHISSQRLVVEAVKGMTAMGEMSHEEAAKPMGGSSHTFRWRYRVDPNAARHLLNAYFEYQLCTDMMCLAPEKVEINYENVTSIAADKTAADGLKTGAEMGSNSDTKVSNVGEKLAQDGASSDSSLNNSVLSEASVASDSAEALAEPLLNGTLPETWAPVVEELKAYEQNANNDVNGENTDAGDGLLEVFLMAFVGGLLALLTPCVWPMIPLTVSYFMKRGENRRGTSQGGMTGIAQAVLFGASIVIIFLAMGVVVTLCFGANAMNVLSTNAVFNVVCFLVLTMFGLSLLGLFELKLPSSWGDKLDTMSASAGGVLGIFLMALTMVVVSFSCTAPVIGLLLVEMADVMSAGVGAGKMLTPIIGMTGFSLALALPFTLFALFPEWLKRVPRSGSWMTSVRVTLGFIEIAFALKFLSVADMAYGWHILPRKLFIVLWIVLAFACAVYHTIDWSRRRVKPVSRQVVAMVCYSLVFYLVPGLSGAPLTLVSAFLPPAADTVGLVTRDYDEALKEARRTSKNVFIDFTGYGCVNCRKMEAAVFTDPRVRDILYNDYVVVQLYVDDRTPLPAHITVNDKRLRTIGDKWAMLEAHKFGNIAQPFYVIVDDKGKPLTRSYAYDEDPERFLAWLKSAKKR